MARIVASVSTPIGHALGELCPMPQEGDFAWDVLEKWVSSALRNMSCFRPHSAPSLPMPLDGDFAWDVLENGLLRFFAT